MAEILLWQVGPLLRAEPYKSHASEQFLLEQLILDRRQHSPLREERNPRSWPPPNFCQSRDENKVSGNALIADTRLKPIHSLRNT